MEDAEARGICSNRLCDKKKKSKKERKRTIHIDLFIQKEIQDPKGEPYSAGLGKKSGEKSGESEREISNAYRGETGRPEKKRRARAVLCKKKMNQKGHSRSTKTPNQQDEGKKGIRKDSQP